MTPIPLLPLHELARLSKEGNLCINAENDETPFKKRPPQHALTPDILSRQEVEAFYDLLGDLQEALELLHVPHAMINRSLMSGLRSQSVPFHHDMEKIDVAIINEEGAYEHFLKHFPKALIEVSRSKLKPSFHRRQCATCDQVKSGSSSRVKIDIFVLKKYANIQELGFVLGATEDGTISQYSQEILQRLEGQGLPLYHYDNRQAIELRPGEAYSYRDLFPMRRIPLGRLSIPVTNKAVRLLSQFFGNGCFTQESECMSSMHECDSQNSILSDRIDHPELSDENHIPTDYSKQAQKKWLTECHTSLDEVLMGDEMQAVATLGMRRTRTMVTLSLQATIPTTLPKASAPAKTKPKYFGVDVRAHTNDSQEVPVFDQALRDVMEPHIAKARRKREESWNKGEKRLASISRSDVIGALYPTLRAERPFLFDANTYPIHSVLCETLGISDLSMVHQHPIQDKFDLMKPLLDRATRRPFHQAYDNFVINFCIPLLHSLGMSKNAFQSKTSASSQIVYRYQAFPCIRVVRPGEFSIGPHCDTAYGHSLGNLNFHIPLTTVFGTNALYTESHPGREDWHPLTAKSPGIGYLFDGVRCLHFTLENTTPHTRVSLDFRVSIYHEGDSDLCYTKDELNDAYCHPEGYYDEAVIHSGPGVFPLVVKKRSTALLGPDRRVGFPFTKVPKP